MIEQELLLLGLLRESPKHGYEIKKEIRKILSLFAGLDLKSVYYPLKILEKKGLIGERVLKAGRRPERRVYYLTPKGSERFSELLSKSFLNFKRPRFSIDLSLYFLSYIEPRIAKRRLRARMQILKKLSKGLKGMVVSLKKKPSSSVFMLEHNLHMLNAECQFLSSFIKRI
ncbi:MAG: PadR family transcriptional regulator [Candidatus Omnitrophota bacterium]|jgi:DNA-binding PadR family transcriptional regulator